MKGKTPKTVGQAQKGPMGSSSHFLAEWKEKEVMDYMKGKIPKPPSNALVAKNIMVTNAEVEVNEIIRDSLTSFWWST